MDNIKAKVGEKIKQFRVMRGLTQHDLAEKIGLTEKQISKIETGVHYPKFENFVKILDVLNIDDKQVKHRCNQFHSTSSRTIAAGVLAYCYQHITIYQIREKQIHLLIQNDN